MNGDGEMFSLLTIGRYIYNDSLWLAEKLRSYEAQWNDRHDLPVRAKGKLQLGKDILLLENFGKRAYKNEMNTQRTVLKDLLGGQYKLIGRERNMSR